MEKTNFENRWKKIKKKQIDFFDFFLENRKIDFLKNRFSLKFQLKKNRMFFLKISIFLTKKKSKSNFSKMKNYFSIWFFFLTWYTHPLLRKYT